MNDSYSAKMPGHKKASTLRSVLKILSSVKLAVTLLALIAVALIVATLIKNQTHARRYIYHSWWFISLLSLFCLNLLLCTAGRWSLRLRRLGTTVTHAGVLVLIIGVLLGAFFGQRGSVRLWVGEGTTVCYDDEKNEIPLPFEIHLDAFKVERYSSPREALVVHLLKEGAVQALPIELNRQFEVARSPYRITIIRYEPDFVLLGKGKYGSRSNSPNNPAIQVQVTNGSQENIRWVFLKFPGMHQDEDSNVLLDYRRLDMPGGIKDFKSKLRLIQRDKLVASKTIEVNRPLRYDGWAIYQSSYDSIHEAWSGLGIARDPGVNFVYIGFVLISAGVLFTFYVRPVLMKKANSQPTPPTSETRNRKD